MEGMEEDEEDGGEQGDSAAAGGVGVGVGVAGRDGGQGGSVTVELTEDENAAVENVRRKVVIFALFFLSFLCWPVGVAAVASS